MRKEDVREGMRVKVEVEGEVSACDGVLVRVQRKCVKGEPGSGWSNHAHWVPLSACTPILPDVREGDLVELRCGDDILRGRVLPICSGGVVDKNKSAVKVSTSWGDMGGSYIWIKLKYLTILERADGSKP